MVSLYIAIDLEPLNDGMNPDIYLVSFYYSASLTLQVLVSLNFCKWSLLMIRIKDTIITLMSGLWYKTKILEAMD